MIKRFLAIFALAFALTACAASPRDVLGQLGSALGGSQSSDSGQSSSALGGLGDFLNNILANDSFDLASLTGTWNYSSPAVTFESSNVLQSIGGAAGATALENQLEPYYRRLGFTRTSLTVDEEQNFTLKLGLVTLKGKIEKDDDNRLVFNFSAFNRISLGSVTANATKSGNTLNLTFDATRLINILNKVAGAVNNTTLSALSSLLSSYDGVFIGFKLAKA